MSIVIIGLLAGIVASAPRAMFLSLGFGSRIAEARFATAALGMALLLGAIVPLLLE
ncbi:MAG: hypothetical protein H0X39_05370 [Actinobacteria bacterium]|nr:hypothetical protein [Actinomycetota bacterium]